MAGKHSKLRTPNSEIHTPIIAMSASAFEEEQTAALSKGCDDFLRKPFREEDVFELMHKHLGVRYVYEEEQKIEDRRQKAEDNEGLKSEMLVALPPEFLKKLEYATITTDVNRISTLIHETRHYDLALADALARLIADFEYAKILNFIQEAKNT